METIQLGFLQRVQDQPRITNAFQVLKTIPGSSWRSICTHCQGGREVILQNYTKSSNRILEGKKKNFLLCQRDLFFLNSSAVEGQIHFCMCPSTHPSKKEEERRENVQASLLSQTDVTGRMKTIANPRSCSSSAEASQHADWPKLIQLSADTAETLLGHRQRQTLGDWKESVRCIL